jgi:hypothetical protein
MLKALKRMPVFVAIALMVLMMMGGVVLGNGNALDHSAGNAWAELAQIQQSVVQMANRASNHQAIAGRLGMEGDEVNALKQAQAAAQKMGNRSVQSMGASATQEILNAANALNDAVLNLDEAMKAKIQTLSSASDAKIEEEARTRAYDNWVDNRLGIAQRKEYNSVAETTRAVYEALPAKALLGNKLPPLFE